MAERDYDIKRIAAVQRLEKLRTIRKPGPIATQLNRRVRRLRAKLKG